MRIRLGNLVGFTVFVLLLLLASIAETNQAIAETGRSRVLHIAFGQVLAGLAGCAAVIGVGMSQERQL